MLFNFHTVVIHDYRLKAREGDRSNKKNRKTYERGKGRGIRINGRKVGEEKQVR